MKIPGYDNFQAAPNGLPQTRMSSFDGTDAGADLRRAADAAAGIGGHFSELALQRLTQANQALADRAWVDVEDFRLRLQQEYGELRGVNALVRPDGKSLADEFNGRLNDFIAERAGALHNDVQVQMFAHRVGGLQAEFADDVSKHMLAQQRKYTGETQQAAAGVTVRAIQLATDDAAMDAAVGRLQGIVGDMQAFDGWSPERAQAELFKRMGEAMEARASRLMDAGEFDVAEAELKRYAPMMDGKTAGDLAAKIVRFRLEAQGEALGEQLGVAAFEGGAVQVVGGDAGLRALTGKAAVAKALDLMIHHESRGKVDAQNPFSSAGGLGGFIDSTWLAMVKRYRPDVAAGKSNGQILALKKSDGKLAREMTLRYMEENARGLEKAGFASTMANIRMAHWFGLGGAVKLLGLRDKGVPIASVVEPLVMKQNPNLRGKSVAQVVAITEREMYGGKVKTAKIEQGNKLQAQQQLADIKNPVVRKAAEARLEKTFGRLEAQERRDKADAMNVLLDIAAQGGDVSKAPSAVRGVLSPHELEKVYDYEKRRREGRDGEIRKGSEAAYYDLKLNPEKLRAFGEQEILAMGAVFGMPRAAELVQARRNLDKHGSTSEPKITADVAKTIAGEFGLKTEGKNRKGDDVQKYYYLVDSLSDMQKAFYQQHKRYMSNAELLEAGRKAMGDKLTRSYVKEGWLWDSKVRDEVPALLGSGEQKRFWKYEKGQ